MVIRYSDGVELCINITDQIKQDFRECQEKASAVGNDGKNCDSCSLNVEIEGGTALCELPLVVENLEGINA